jgi:hypothetical protein
LAAGLRAAGLTGEGFVDCAALAAALNAASGTAHTIAADRTMARSRIQQTFTITLP